MTISSYFVKQSVLLWSLSRDLCLQESCQFGASYNREQHRMISYHISSNSLGGSVMKKNDNNEPYMRLYYYCSPDFLK